MRANQQIHGMKGSSSSCRLRILFLLALSMGMLVASAESRSVFGSRTVAAALFGKNEKEAGMERPPIHSPPGKPRNPPPPPPGRPPLPTTPADQQQQQTNAAIDRKAMPPPPPPKLDGDPSKEDKGEAIKAAESSTETGETVAANPQEPALPVMVDSQKNEPWSQQQQQQVDSQQQQQQQPWGGAWENDPQYAQQQQPYYAGDSQYNNQQWPTIEQQLDESINREYMLASQVQNLTETIRAVQSQDQLHTRQMDVLTERIMEAEAQIAHEHNAALEYQTNCTEMARQIAVLHDELLDWQSRCAGFADQHKVSETKIKELKKDLKEARAEAENLAISIENSRIRDHMDGSSLTKKKKSRGLLGWIFSFLVSSSSSEPEVDKDRENPQALAKSTLLKALQIERNNVDELDAFVASLQQNNSAIAEMVKSRDLIIDELNERIAVFEEDKVVLKAALKQLQKEMKEEAPKSQKMVDDLEAASQEVARLNAEIASIIEMHENEISALLQSISQKQSAINASETKHSEIGRYVDMLEERLANFSITRRDLEVREQSCKEAEALAEQMEGERDNLRSKIAELETERNDFKSLFEELGQELASLREENGRLIDEKEALEKGAQRSREALASLENNMKRLDQESEKWKTKTAELETELKSTKTETTEIQGGVNETKTQNENLKKQLASLRVLNSELLEQIEAKTSEASSAQEQIAVKSSEVTKKEEMLKSKVDELSENEAKLKAVSTKLQQLEETLQKKAADQKEAPQGKPKGPRLRGPFSGKNDDHPSQIDKAANVSADPAPNQNKTSVHPPQRVGDKALKASPGRIPQLPSKKDAQQAKKKRKVPLRKIRKVFSRVTGIHNAFTRPSEKGTLKGPPPAQPKDLNRRQKEQPEMPSEQQQKRTSPLHPPSQQSSPQGGLSASEPGSSSQNSPPKDGVFSPGQQQRRASPLQPGGPNQYLPSREGMGAPGQQQQQQRRSPPWLQESAQPPKK